MKDWRGKGPSVYYYDLGIVIDGKLWWVPTFTHSGKHHLNLS